MKLFAIACLINLVSSVSLGFFVYLSNRRARLNVVWCIFELTIALWSLGLYLVCISQNISLALVGDRILYMGAIFIPVVFLHFVYILVDGKKFVQQMIKYGYLLGSIFFIFNFTCLFRSGFKAQTGFAYWMVPGPVYYVYVLMFFIYISYSVCLMFKGALEFRGLRANQIRYVFVAALISFGGGSTNFLPQLIQIYPFGNFLVAVHTFVITYAILRYRLMDIRIVVTRTSIFLIVFALVIWFPFWIGYRTKSWVLSALFMAVFASGGPVIHRMLQRKAENVLMAQQKRYQRALINAGKGMVREHDLNKLMRLIVRVVKMTVKIEFVGAFLKDKEHQCFRLTVVRGINGLPDPFILTLDHPLAQVIEKKRDPVDYEEINPSIDDAFVKSIHLVVPSFGSDGQLLAFLVLGEKVDQSVYTQDDIDVFRILSHQASLAIENCLFVEETKESQRRLFQAEKLASIGGMADGVAHQIKNRLNHFSIASGEAQYEIQDFLKAHPEMVEQSPDLKKTFDYLLKISQSLIDNVKRTNSVIQGILNYARVEEKDTFFSTFNVNEILNLSLELLRVKHEIAVFPLVIEGDVNMEIYGVKAQIMEAIYNILDNCYEAVQEKFKYNLSPEEQDTFQHEIRLKFTQDAAKFIIEINDNGIGIKDEDHHKIFAPFFTTKSSYKSGSGIGMYVVKRMIEENHNGKITFQSEYMKGTYFRIELPKKV